MSGATDLASSRPNAPPATSRIVERMLVAGLLDGSTERNAARRFALLARAEANARRWLSAGTAVDPMTPPSPRAA